MNKIQCRYDRMGKTWNAGFVRNPYTEFGGDTPARAVKRLTEATFIEPVDPIPVEESEELILFDIQGSPRTFGTSD